MRNLIAAVLYLIIAIVMIRFTVHKGGNDGN